MKSEATERDVHALQRRVEQAIRAARPRAYIVRLLEELIAVADRESDVARLAHRHLGELRLEESPWHAALHLRKVLLQDPDDDIAYALMGLCQALQANFRSAVAAYRRAVALEPNNPWYSHNLGHLLDVALGASRDALPHLRRAHAAEPGQQEVTASLAHCLGRLGRRDEALALARSLTKKDPRDPNHRALLDWIERGATPAKDATVPGLLSTTMPTAAPGRGAPDRTDEGDARSVEALVTAACRRTGRSASDTDRALTLWRDYERLAGPVTGRPEGFAAAVEYALARVDGSGDTQRDVAARHGISTNMMERRFAAIRTTLALKARDRRYAASAVGGSARRSREDEPST